MRLFGKHRLTPFQLIVFGFTALIMRRFFPSHLYAEQWEARGL